MGISELETAARLKLPLVCIVYNDAAYGAEVHHFASEHTEAELVQRGVPGHGHRRDRPRIRG